MTETISAMSWNVQGEIGIGDVRMQRQLDFLDNHTTDIDLFLFQAVNHEEGLKDGWQGQLGEFLTHFSNRDYEYVQEEAVTLVYNQTDSLVISDGTRPRSSPRGWRTGVTHRFRTVKSACEASPLQSLGS